MNMSYDHLIPDSNRLEAFLPRLVSGRTPEHPTGNMIAEAYHKGFHGCWVDSADAPDWVRRVARYSMDQLRSFCRCQFVAELAIPAEVRGIGAGKRAVHFQLAMKLDARIFQGSQAFSNCAAWCAREIEGQCIALDIIANGEPHQYKARPGTASVYSNRHTGADSGMTLGDAAAAAHSGITCELSYLDGKYDLSTQALDERAGVNWGRSGMPADLRELVKGDVIEQISRVQDKEAVMDLLQAGHGIATGSTRTAGGPGDPVSPIGPVGAHAQALIGYDDTDEFRDWYAQTTGKKITDCVYIFDQSWGPSWLKVTNWPEHLWGPRPEGAFVLLGNDGQQLVTQWGEAIAYSKVKGFPLLKLPDWGTAAYL